MLVLLLTLFFSIKLKKIIHIFIPSTSGKSLHLYHHQNYLYLEISIGGCRSPQTTWAGNHEDRSLGLQQTLWRPQWPVPFSHFWTPRPHLQPKHPGCVLSLGLPSLKTYDVLLETAVISWQWGIFVSFLPSSLGLFSPFFPWEPSPHPPIIPFLLGSSTVVSAENLAEKILSLCTFQRNYQPKKFREKNSLSLMGFLSQSWPGGTRVPRKSKLMSALPWGVEGRQRGQPNWERISFWAVQGRVRVLNRKSKGLSS